MRTVHTTDSPALPPSDSGELETTDRQEPGVTDYLQIRDYWRIVERRRWLIVGFLVAGLLGGLLHNWSATEVFEARATLQIEGDPNILALDRPLVDRWDWAREFLPTQLGILASRDLARIAHEELTRSERALPPRERAQRVPSVDEIAMGRTIESVRDTRLVNVGFRSTDPVLAARVSNALAHAYVQRSRDFRSRTTGEASDWLTEQVEQQRKVVEASEAALQVYRETHGADALFTDRLGVEQQNIVVQKLGELQAAVSKARAETIEREAQYQQLAEIRANQDALDTLPAIAANAYIQGLKGELSALQRQLLQASEELGARHPEIIKLQAAVQNAQRKLQTEIDNVASAIRNDFEAAQARDRALAVALQRQRFAVQALNSKAVEYTALEREATSNREVLDKLLQRSREASLTRELQSTSIGIVDRAEIPASPFLPRKGRTLMLSLVGSGALAFGLIFMLEIFNTRMISPEDVERHLHISVLGVIPQVKTEQGEQPLLHHRGAAPRFDEQLHTLRTNVMRASGSASAHTLVVTSSEPGEGKTLTAANLAMSLARLNQQVLLIDADLRKPKLHELFGEELEPGLSDVLARTAKFDAFRKTKIPRVWLMPAGKVTRNPADLLGSEVFSALVNQASQRFDWVILDSPPVLAVTDACLIGRVASGVLFVVGSGQTSREVARAAMEQLDAAGCNLVGVTLNRALLDQPGLSYLPYYHRNYESYYLKQEGSSWEPDAPDPLSEDDSAGVIAPAVRG